MADPVAADVVHCHTWYAHLGGILAKLAYGIPLVVTVHSLEPLRPWKREQLGGGYDASSWVERTALEMADAVIAVSEGTREDVVRHFAVARGADRRHPQRDRHRRRTGPSPATDALDAVRDRPGRAVRAVRRADHPPEGDRPPGPRDPGHRHAGGAVVLCAGAPDTPEIAAEMEAAVRDAQAVDPNVLWIAEMVDKPTVLQLYSHAAVFGCPSVYEPFGIINLEAMACEARSSRARWAASRRWSSRARPACSCRSSRQAAGPSSRRPGRASSATSRRGSTS